MKKCNLFCSGLLSREKSGELLLQIKINLDDINDNFDEKTSVYVTCLFFAPLAGKLKNI